MRWNKTLLDAAPGVPARRALAPVVGGQDVRRSTSKSCGAIVSERRRV
jgi:hypothetical protein